MNLRLGETLISLLEQYGECYDLGVLWEETFFTTSPEHLKIILSTNFDNFEKGDDFFNCASSVLGSGVFNSDGKRRLETSPLRLCLTLRNFKATFGSPFIFSRMISRVSCYP